MQVAIYCARTGLTWAELHWVSFQRFEIYTDWASITLYRCDQQSHYSYRVFLIFPIAAKTAHPESTCCCPVLPEKTGHLHTVRNEKPVKVEVGKFQIMQYEVSNKDFKALIEATGYITDLSLIHISEPTRLGMISYAVFCLKKKNR